MTDPPLNTSPEVCRQLYDALEYIRADLETPMFHYSPSVYKKRVHQIGVVRAALAAATTFPPAQCPDSARNTDVEDRGGAPGANPPAPDGAGAGDFCEWCQDDEGSSTWENCEDVWWTEDPDPPDFKWCPYCRKAVKFIKWKEPE